MSAHGLNQLHFSVNYQYILFARIGTDKKGAAGGAAAFGENDLEKMRSSIQVLVQHTGPLGTCMDYIQEDVSLMTAELHRWEEECRK